MGFERGATGVPEGSTRFRAVQWALGWVPPFVASRLRTQALRACGMQIGHASAFWGMPTVLAGPPKNLSVGIFCGFNKGCVFDLSERVTVGEYVAVGHEVMLLTRNRQAAASKLDELRSKTPLCAAIVIENGVWLGARCVVMPGVTIGAGSVVAAGMVVSQSVPANTLLAGPVPVSLARWR